MVSSIKYEREKELMNLQMERDEKKVVNKLKIIKEVHNLEMERIKAEKEMEELKQRNFLIRRNLLGEEDLRTKK